MEVVGLIKSKDKEAKNQYYNHYLNALNEVVQCAICEFTLEEQPKLAYANSKVYEVIGYTKDEFDNWEGPWYGGWVYGLGYVYPDVNIYGYQGGTGSGYYGFGYYGYGYVDNGYGDNGGSNDGNKRGDIIKSDWACMFNCMNYLDSSKSAQEYYEYFTSIFGIDAFEEGGLPYEYHVTALRACGFSCEETSSITGGGYHFLAIIDPGNGRTHAVIITEKNGDLVTIYDPSIISDKPEDKSYKVHVGRIKTMYKVK